MRYLPLAALAAILFSGPAFAQAVGECPDLTTLQRLAGYVTLLGLVKIIGACVFAAGFLYMFSGIIAKVIFQSRVLLEIAAYIGSAALIASGYWLEDPEHLTWTVFVGCLMFGATVMMTLWIHNIKGDDPKALAAFFMVVWGAIAIFYNMTEVGFLSAMALMTVLGFSIIVEPMCYAFGFEKRESVPTATMTGLLLLGAFCVIHVLVPDAPAAIQVFKPGVFWVASFVAFIGLLIMSSKWYNSGPGYFVLQLLTVVTLAGALVFGMVFAVNPLAGMAGTFLVFYLASKPLEIPADSHITVGIMLMLTGGILYGAWWYGNEHSDFVSTYLTTQF